MAESINSVESALEIGGGGGAIIIAAPTEHEQIRINKWRVREGVPVRFSQVVLLYEVLSKSGELIEKSIQKLKSSRVGVVKKRHFKDGDIVEKGASLLELFECVHTTVIKDMCADCGCDLRQNENGNTSEASVPMVHSIPDLKVTQKLAQKLGHDDTRRLLEDRKLVLLVDLDQTVIHTTNDNVPNNIKGIYHFQLYGPHSPWYHTRLRPGTPHFLERMSKYYELHICTFGARNYAHMIAQLLDPDGKFFSHRILSRDECFNATSKTDNLKALFPNGDSMVCIIDDREDVWNMASNLIQVKPYHFFQHTGDINAPPGLSKHELDGEGVDFKDLNLTNDNGKTDATTTADSSKNKPDDNTDDNVDNVEAALFDTPQSSQSEVDTKIDTTISKTDDITNSSDKSTDEIQIDTKSENISEDNKEQNTELTNTITQQNENANTSADADADDTTPTSQKKDDNSDNSVIQKNIEVNSSKFKQSTDLEKQIEIEDPDDYLLHLEVILGHIHSRFYAIYDETKEIPDLKIIVPKIRSEVLRGKHLVFSGLVPTNMQLEQSRAYFIAKSLGADVTQNIGPETTHLVAVTSGTFKVNAAKKNAQIKVVNANWLWSCAERWEHVEEKLFPLDRINSKNKQRQPPAHCHSPEHVVNYSEKSEISSSSSAQQVNASVSEKFIDTINPLLSFSNADLADMNKEFDQFFESDSSSEEEHVNIENPPVDKSLRKRKREEKEEDRTREFFTRTADNILSSADPNEMDKSSNEDDNDDNDDDDEPPSTKFRRGEALPSDVEESSPDSDNNNPDSEDDGEWNMMGAALEREFLGLED